MKNTIQQPMKSNSEKDQTTKSIASEYLKQQNETLAKQVTLRTIELEKALKDLQEIQSHLLLSEKMASLGKLAAGIAHEIKNPINFINNFSELSLEYLEEIKELLNKLDQNEILEEVLELIEDIKSNLEKTHLHGTRADGIVKSMLMHSRGGKGKFEQVDLNGLLQEYVNLAFHGMRASKHPINVSFDWQLDPEISLVSLVSEDFSRIIVNLCTNSFDAMRTKLESLDPTDEYQPTLSIRTYEKKSKVTVEFEDNGSGIPKDILGKILEPFFTTKKAKEGTGLGLPIVQDIVTAHKGSLAIVSEVNVYTKFTISLSAINLKK